MTFHSILFERPEHGTGVEQREAPAFFRDLNLDQVVASITASRAAYRLEPFFGTPLRDVEAIEYRQEILRDLEGNVLWECVGSFARTMRSRREHLAQADKLHYAESPEFTSLVAETARLDDELAAVTDCLHIQDNRITVSTYDSEPDYAADVEDTFEKFKQGAVRDYRVDFPGWPEMNHIEAGVLDRVALLYPEVFAALDDYCHRHREYLDPTIADFDREVQFYVAYVEYVRRFTAAGLTFCYPRVSERSKDVCARSTFDVALAERLIRERSPVVCNDFELSERERIVVVTGPNQGGKTTFARTFGFKALSELRGRGINLAANALAQSADHILSFFRMVRAELGFYIGCLNVHGQLAGKTGANQGGKSTFLRSVGLAQLMMQAGMFVGAAAFRANVCDALFTHYKREEDATMKSGKLDEELGRMSAIADRIRPGGLVLFNESFSATNEREGAEIATAIVRARLEAGIKVFFVTHSFELAHGFHRQGLDAALFLRAERQADGRRTFKLVDGEPLPTGYGEDLYRNVFGEAPADAPAAPRATAGAGPDRWP